MKLIIDCFYYLCLISVEKSSYYNECLKLAQLAMQSVIIYSYILL